MLLSQVVATACLFLACKVHEAPKALKDVVAAMWGLKVRGNIPEINKIHDRVRDPWGNWPIPQQ